MKYIKFLFKKNLLFIISLLFITSVAVFAAPPSTPYNANETLDPSCAPGDTNCIVQISAGSDNLGNHTATGNILLNGHWLSNDGGNEGVFVSTGGNVGIGTNTPISALDIVAGTNANKQLRLGSLGEAGIVGFKRGSDGVLAGLVGYSGATNADDFIVANWSGGGRVNVYGNAGIGFSTIPTTATGWIEGMRLLQDGNVGIGTVTPSYKLDVSGGNARLSNTVPSLYLQDNDTLSSSNSVAAVISFRDSAMTEFAWIGDGGGSANDFGIVNAQNSNTFFSVNGAERMRIDSNGNVGIGTSSPISKLDIINEDSPSNGKIAYLINRDPDQLTLFDIRNENGNGNGNISFVRGPDLGGVDYSMQINTSGNNSLSFGVHGGYNSMVIRKNGNVGIGTVSPGDKLEVNGYGKFSSSIKLPGAGASSTGYYACIDGTTGEIYKGGGACTLSDKRLKKDITNLESGDSLERVLGLQGVTFQWKEGFRGDAINIGFIAQDVEKVFPEAVTENPDGMKAMNYEFIIAPLVEAVKELYNRLTSNDEDIATLKKVIELQQQQMEAQQAQIDILKAKIK